MRAGLNRHPAGDLTHRRQQWQAAVIIGHRFVGDGDSTGVDQPLGLFRIGRQMQVSEQHLPLTQHGQFRRLRLLYLHHHVGTGENVGGGANDLCPDGAVIVVFQANRLAGVGFDDDAVAIVDRLTHAGRRHADAVLVRLDLLGHANQHDALP